MNNHDFNDGFGLQSRMNELEQYKELVSRCYDDIAALKKAHREAIEFNNALTQENIVVHDHNIEMQAELSALRESYNLMTTTAVSWFDELEALRERTRWMPVTERLPDNWDEQLLLMCEWVDNGHESIYERVDDWCSVRDNKSPEKVTHWMPLPPAPGEGE